jgi:hypothetical protein
MRVASSRQDAIRDRSAAASLERRLRRDRTRHRSEQNFACGRPPCNDVPQPSQERSPESRRSVSGTLLSSTSGEAKSAHSGGRRARLEPGSCWWHPWRSSSYGTERSVFGHPRWWAARRQPVKGRGVYPKQHAGPIPAERCATRRIPLGNRTHALGPIGPSESPPVRTRNHLAIAIVPPENRRVSNNPDRALWITHGRWS